MLIFLNFTYFKFIKTNRVQFEYYKEIIPPIKYRWYLEFPSNAECQKRINEPSVLYIVLNYNKWNDISFEEYWVGFVY